jgi:tetratricopeptide (TPR) repeat protein
MSRRLPTETAVSRAPVPAIVFSVLLASAALASCAPGGDSDSVAEEGAEVGAAETFDRRLGEYLAAYIAAGDNDLDNATHYYDQVIEVDPDNTEIVSAASLFSLAAGKVERAIELAQRVIDAEVDDDGTSALVVAAGAIRNGDFADATELVAGIPVSGLNRLIAPLVHGWTLAGDGKVDEGLAVLEALSTNQQYLPFYLYHRALILAWAGRAAEADSVFEEGLELATGVRQIEVYGNYLEQQGRPEEAATVYRAFLEAEPGNRVLSAALRRVQAGETSGPLLTSAQHGVAEVFHTVGASLAQENSLAPARNFSRLAVYLNPEFDAAKMVLADIMDREGMIKDANDVLETVPRESSYSWEARMAYAQHLARLGGIFDAVTILEEMDAEEPDGIEPLVAIGDIYREASRFNEAADAYTLAVDKIAVPQQDDWYLFYTRATTLERSNQWERAEADFLMALELEPNEPYVLNYLGYSWIEMGRNVEEATDMIVRAVQQQPTAGFIVDSLGWGYFKLGNYEEAVRQLERAVQLTPGDSTLNDHLGDAYWRVGRQREAVFQWQHALDLGATEEVVTIERKIRQGLPD